MWTGGAGFVASKRIEIPGIIFAPQQPALGAAALRIAILVDSVIIVLYVTRTVHSRPGRVELWP